MTDVEFYVDGGLVRAFEEPPYSHSIDLPEFPPGEHVFEAVAYDAYGHSTTEVVEFTVQAVSIAVTPAQVTLAVGRTQSFAASVTGVLDETVVWSVAEPVDCGSVADDGTYRAPDLPGFCSVVATLGAVPDRRATALVKVFTGDLNGDGVVDGEDLGLMARAYGSVDGEAIYSTTIDLDGDDVIDDTDVSFLLSEFGR